MTYFDWKYYFNPKSIKMGICGYILKHKWRGWVCDTNKCLRCSFVIISSETME